MPDETDNILRLADIHLYGLDHDDYAFLLRAEGITPLDENHVSLKIDKALFVKENSLNSLASARIAQGAFAQRALGRYQSVTAGFLYTPDGRTRLPGEYVLKLPRVASADSLTSIKLESQKASLLHVFHSIFPHPQGYALLNESSQSLLCCVQGRIKGKTLFDILYDDNGIVNIKALRKFCENIEPNDPWLACKQHIPMALVIKHIFIPIAELLVILEEQDLQHNDISPANIMWSKSDGYKLVDVALTAEIGATSFGQGTLPYALPIEPGNRVCAGTDMRALCAICWQLFGFQVGDSGSYIRHFEYKDISLELLDRVVNDTLPTINHTHEGVSKTTQVQAAQAIGVTEARLCRLFQNVLDAHSEELQSARQMLNSVKKELIRLRDQILILIIAGDA